MRLRELLETKRLFGPAVELRDRSSLPKIWEILKSFNNLFLAALHL